MMWIGAFARKRRIRLAVVSSSRGSSSAMVATG